MQLFFSKIDLIEEYTQIPMTAYDRCRAAIITPFVFYEFSRTPFGLRNAAQIFQSFIEDIFRDLNFEHVYVDDCLIAILDRGSHSHIGNLSSND